MARGKKRSGGKTAAELMAELSQDEDYLRMKAAQEKELQARAEVLRRAEQPIVDDLARAGVEVSSVWDLVNTSEPYPDALPILLDHLQRGGYPDRVMESLARALAVRPAASVWETFRDLYLRAEGRGEEGGLAVALAASATEEHLGALIDLLGDESKGDTRGHLMRAIKRVGGKRGRKVLESLTSHPLFGEQARIHLKSRR
ncbi:hypothetical protein G1H11_17705 [Phytoactinopolyspora alkaliphila]|uniref:HEAT repeat domain-containing protein n=1 Tax=Phytoactinopolyspora alkaliphila TaxID=1783498 RepID=A0A6N9YQB3_9ACTN|nr:hypothetical protein [Phytoactinopolyspora alkaliphila]NED97137.1 hypothetical protein [Phytoactinopolyspora alkaliphila]